MRWTSSVPRSLHDGLSGEHMRLLAAVNGLPTGFVLFDTNNAVILKNPAIDAILEIAGSVATASELGQGFAGINLLGAMFEESAKTRQPVLMPAVSYKKKYLKLSCTPVIEAGEVKAYALLAEDITDAKVADRSKDEFFSIASHELRTPLTSIKGNSSMILDYYKDMLQDHTLREMVEDMHTSAIRLIDIVNDFLDMSRLEQGKVSFSYAAVPIEKVIEGVVYEMKTVLDEKKIYLKFDKMTLDSLPPVWVDANRLKQVVYNLVGNASKFTEQGGITISCQLDEGRNLVKVLISDTGLGMTPASQQLLFHKFQQASSSTMTRDTTRGTGLGLYISKMIVESMGGNIALESSAEGQGTVFSFTVPLAKPDQQVSALPAIAAADPPTTSTVLAVHTPEPQNV